MLETLGNKSKEIGRTAVGTVEEHPVTMALVVAGLGLGGYWAAQKLKSDGRVHRQAGAEYPSERKGSESDAPDVQAEYQDSEYYTWGVHPKEDQPETRFDEAEGRGAEQVGQAAEESRQFTEKVEEKTKALREKVRGRMYRGRGALSNLFERNPFVIGGVAMLAGMAAGFMMPETRREDELMGRTRESLRDKVSEFGHRTYEKVSRVAREAGNCAKEEAEKQHLPVTTYDRETTH